MAQNTRFPFIDQQPLLDAVAKLQESITATLKQTSSSNGFAKSGTNSTPNANKPTSKIKPKEKIRVCKEKGHFKYYIITGPRDTNGKFIPKKKWNTACKIIQQEYEEKLNQFLKKSHSLLGKIGTFFEENSVEKIIAEIHPGRKALLLPALPQALLPKELFVAQWLAKPYKELPFAEGAPEYFTSNGTRVRSKSEVIIADALTRGGIPFRYEQALTLECSAKSSRGPREVTLHPDFTCLNPRTRSEFIWEHFGLMSDPDYAHNAILKITEYAASGYVLGKKLIATFEDGETPLSTKLVQTYIEEYLK